jgi:hypothetical protein
MRHTFSISSCAFSVRPDTNASVNGVRASLLVMVVLAATFKSSETVCRLLPLQRSKELTALSQKFNGQLSKVEALLGELEHPHVLAKELLFMHKTVAFALLTKCSLIKSVDHPHQVFIGRGQAENLYLAARCNGVLSCAS